MAKRPAKPITRGLLTEEKGEPIGAVIGFMVKVALGTVIAVAVARAMGVAI